MKDIPHVDFKQAKRVYKEFKRKNLSVYHDLYIQSDALLLADVFENVRNMFLKIYELDPAFLIKTQISMASIFKKKKKKTEIELELLTDIDMVLTVEKGIRGGICHAIRRYAAVNNKYLKNYDKNI